MSTTEAVADNPVGISASVGDPRTATRPHDGIERRGQATGGLAAPDFFTVERVQVRLTVRDDDELCPADPLADNAFERSRIQAICMLQRCPSCATPPERSMPAESSVSSMVRYSLRCRVSRKCWRTKSCPRSEPRASSRSRCVRAALPHGAASEIAVEERERLHGHLREQWSSDFATSAATRHVQRSCQRTRKSHVLGIELTATASVRVTKKRLGSTMCSSIDSCSSVNEIKSRVLASPVGASSACGKYLLRARCRNRSCGPSGPPPPGRPDQPPPRLRRSPELQRRRKACTTSDFATCSKFGKTQMRNKEVL